MTYPNLFLVAAPRAGSTQLAAWLNTHPDICLSAIKEPNFFAAHEFDPAYVAASHLNDVDPGRSTLRGHDRSAQFAVFRDKSQYQSLFSPMQTLWRMEASTTYLACPEAPRAMAQAAPGARILLLTRDPVARAVSHYGLARRTGRTRAPLMDELRAEQAGIPPLAARYLLRPSRQAEGIARFHAAYPKNQCLILRFEAMIDDPAATLAHIAAWLDLPAQFDLTHQAQNATTAPRFPSLNAALQASGLKTALRRTLPKSLKQRLKPLWFDPSKPAPISAADRAALREALS